MRAHAIGAVFTVLAGCGGGKPPPTPVVAATNGPARGGAAIANTAPPLAPEPPGDDTAAREAAAKAIVAEGTSCVPPSPTASDDDAGASVRSFALAIVNDAPVLCLHENGEAAYHGPLACWTVDAASATLAYRGVHPLPGKSFSAYLTRGCAYGYCVPGVDPNADRIQVQIGWSTTGALVAIGGFGGDDDATIHVFDAASRALLRSVAITGDNGLTNAFYGFAFVGDVLFVSGTDAGPYVGVWTFSAAERAVAGDVQKIRGMPSVYSGGVSVLDQRRVLLAVTGLVAATVADVDTGTVGVIRRKRVPCTAAELEAFEIESDVPAKAGRCKTFLDDEMAPMVDAPMVASRGGDYLAAQLGRNRLVVIDGKSLAIEKAIPLPRCP